MVEEYDTWSLFPMLFKCHHVLHHVLKFETMANQLNDEDFCFDILEMTIETNELAKELVNMEMQMFWKYQVNAKDIKHIMEWWGNMSPCFQLLFSLLVKSLGLWDSRLTLRGFLFLVGILTNSRRLIFVSKNWPIDPRVSFFFFLT